MPVHQPACSASPVPACSATRALIGRVACYTDNTVCSPLPVCACCAAAQVHPRCLVGLRHAVRVRWRSCALACLPAAAALLVALSFPPVYPSRSLFEACNPLCDAREGTGATKGSEINSERVPAARGSGLPESGEKHPAQFFGHASMLRFHSSSCTSTLRARVEGRQTWQLSR